MPDFDFVTATQAAEQLGVSRRTVHYLIERGEFPSARKVDPKLQTSPVMIPVDDLKAYQKKQKAGPAKTHNKKRAQPSG
jgi:DNA-binding XRE family transcriptional regulator